MKKLFVIIMATAMLSAALSGCGSNVEDDNKMEIIPDTIPSVSPYVSPDMEDGVVKDEDGLIEDEDTGSGKDKDDKTYTSPSPAVSPSDSVNN